MIRLTREFAQYLWSHRKWWLVPVVLALLVVGMLVALSQASPLSPFIYPLF